MGDVNPALLRRLRSGEGLEVTPDLIALAREFRATPIGHHSPNLQALLRLFRGQPVAGKHAILCTRPNREWMLVQLSGAKEKPLVASPGHSLWQPRRGGMGDLQAEVEGSHRAGARSRLRCGPTTHADERIRDRFNRWIPASAGMTICGDQPEPCHSRGSGNPLVAIVAMKNKRAGTFVQFRRFPPYPNAYADERPPTPGERGMCRGGWVRVAWSTLTRDRRRAPDRGSGRARSPVTRETLLRLPLCGSAMTHAMELTVKTAPPLGGFEEGHVRPHQRVLGSANQQVAVGYVFLGEQHVVVVTLRSCATTSACGRRAEPAIVAVEFNAGRAAAADSEVSDHFVVADAVEDEPRPRVHARRRAAIPGRSGPCPARCSPPR